MVSPSQSAASLTAMSKTYTSPDRFGFLNAASIDKSVSISGWRSEKVAQPLPKTEPWRLNVTYESNTLATSQTLSRLRNNPQNVRGVPLHPSRFTPAPLTFPHRACSRFNSQSKALICLTPSHPPSCHPGPCSDLLPQVRSLIWDGDCATGFSVCVRGLGDYPDGSQRSGVTAARPPQTPSLPKDSWENP